MGDVASELRGRIAERRIEKYLLAAAIGLHPSRLSRLLNGHLPVTPELAARIRAAIEAVPERRSIR